MVVDIYIKEATRALTLGLVLSCVTAVADAGDPTAAKENVFATKPLGHQGIHQDDRALYAAG